MVSFYVQFRRFTSRPCRNRLCFAFPIDRSARGERRGNRVCNFIACSQLHPRELLHIKNLRALGVLGGKTTELALNWVCFFGPEIGGFLRNALLLLSLHYFSLRANWLCFFNFSSIFRRFLLFFTCFFH